MLPNPILQVLSGRVHRSSASEFAYHFNLHNLRLPQVWEMRGRNAGTSRRKLPTPIGPNADVGRGLYSRTAQLGKYPGSAHAIAGTKPGDLERE